MTQDDKTTTSIKSGLNNTGVFLESIVFTALLRDPRFKALREEPYSGYTSEGFEGTIDVLAVSKVQENTILSLCIECKKADPKQKYWVFEKRTSEAETPYPFEYIDAVKNKIDYEKNIFFPSLGYDGMKYFDQTIETFEFKDQSGELSRTQIERPYFALEKANEAVSSFIDEKKNKIYELLGILNGSRTNILYIPLVVTTANLFMMDYNVRDVVWQSGTIPIDKLKLIPKNWVHYEFPLPYKLRTRYNNSLVGLTKRPSFIVNSEHFADFIEKIVSDSKRYIL